MTVREIISALEAFAPTALQEDYDNCGLIVGDVAMECTGALLCVDVTPERVAEAAGAGFNLIVAHHPLIFKGLKRLNGSNPVERSVIDAIRAGIAIYACHTCLDNASAGVSARMARMLGLEHCRVLVPQTDRMLRLTVFVPTAYAEGVRLALADAGAGQIGNYDSCSYSTEGTGRFRALDGARPFAGGIMTIHNEPEERIEVILPRHLRGACERAIAGAHPYESPAYDFTEIAVDSADTGSGAVGMLPDPLSPAEFAALVKATFGSPAVRCNRMPEDTLIRRVALCGGSGSSMIGDAIRSGADAFLTSDTKYHDFVDYAGRIMIADIGHYESEKCTTAIFQDVIKEKFPNFAVRISQTERNPITYM